ncbi:MAG: hypothetical protein V4787_11245 [Pseudomonadota bacterium]
MSPWRPSLLWRPTHAAWGLDARDLAWRPAQEAAGEVRRAPHAVAWPQALAQLDPGATVAVIAANDIAVHWLQTPPASVSSLDELRLVAAARCAHLHGGAPGDWWIAADWNATLPFVCAALPYSAVTPWQRKLATAGISAHWHTAWGVACGSVANTFPDDGWSALRGPTRFLLWHCRAGRVDCLGMQSMSPGTSDEDANAQALRQIRIEAMRDPSLSGEPPHWVNITAGGTDADDSEAIAALGLAALLQGGAS